MEQISTLSMVLEPPPSFGATVSKVNSLGPYLQGALLERADSEFVGILHRLPFNPYSQCCTLDGEGRVVWRISALTQEVADELIDPVLDMGRVELRAVGATFDVTERSLETVDLKTLLDSIYEEGPSRVRLQFPTPAAFKSQGSYVFMPSVRLIFQNLLMHYSQVYEGSKEIDFDTVDYIDQNVRITSYNLQSRYYAHAAAQDKKIPAFVGSLTLSIGGPASMAGLVRMLLRFGEFAGVGIKTSMGMGGFACYPIQPRARGAHEASEAHEAREAHETDGGEMAR